MEELQLALAAFLRGDVDLGGLLAAIDRAVARDDAAANAFLRDIRQLYDRGRLPPALLSIFEDRVAEARRAPVGATTPPAAGPQGAEPVPGAADSSSREVPPGPAFEDPEAHTRAAAHARSPSPQPSHPADDGAVSRPAPVPRPAPTPPGSPSDEEEHTRLSSSPKPAEATRVATHPGGPAIEATRLTGPHIRPGDSATPPDEEATLIATAGGAAGGFEDAEATRVEPRPVRPAPPTQTDSAFTQETGGESVTPSQASASASYTRDQEFPPQPGEPMVGNVLKDRFELEKLIGRGGMGVVFKAKDRRKVEALDRNPYVALKLLNEGFKRHKESLVALQREARKAQDLKHPNVINIFDFDKDEHGNYFIAMELLSGDPLDRVIRELRNSGGMAPEQALPLIEQMGRALGAAHNHKPAIVHSDFKPGNVFLTAGDEIKVFDFGIARAARPAGGGEHEETNFDASTLGALTPAYASLEMLTGAEPDPRDDIYALAIVAYELLTGKRPFGRKKTAADAKAEGLHPQRIPTLNRRQWRGLERGLALERTQRTPTVEQFLDDLRFRKSRTHWYVAAGTIGFGVAAWLFAVDPYLKQRREGEILAAAAVAAPDALPALVTSAQDLPLSAQERVFDEIAARLLKPISGGGESQSAAAFAIAGKLPTRIRDAVRSQGADILIERLLGGERAAAEGARRVIDGLPPELAGQIYEETTKRLVEAITGAKPEELGPRIASARLLPGEYETQVFTRAKDPIIEYYKASARAAFAPDTGRYDYAAAKASVDQAATLFPDSKTVDGERERLEGSYNQLISDLDEKLNALVAAGQLLPGENGDSVPQVLATLSGLDPNKYPAAYAHLAVAYLQRATEARQAQDLGTAQVLIESGLRLFPENAALRNEQTNLAFARTRLSEEQTIAEIKSRVEPELAKMASPEDFARLLEDLRRLQELRPDDPLLTKAREGIDQLLDAQLAPLLETHAWAQAEALLGDYANLLPPQTLSTKRQRLSESRAAFEQRIGDLSRQVAELAGSRKPEEAVAALDDLRKLAGDDPRIAQGEKEITRAYLALAREARAAGQWEQARAFANEGLQRISNTQITAVLREELTQIAEAEQASQAQLELAERERLERERQARIAEIRTEFDSRLTEKALDEQGARDALAILDRLAAVSPTDPLIGEGRTRVADRMASEAERLGSEGKWESGMDLIRTGQGLIPEAAALATQMGKLREGYAKVLAERKAEEVDQRVEALRTLIGKPAYTTQWSKDLVRALQAVEALTDAGDERLVRARDDIANLYLARLGELRGEKQFAEAEALLAEAERIVPQAKARLAEERGRIAADQKAWGAEQQERERLAKIDALQQSLLAKTNANETTKALAILETLRTESGPDDAFVARTAPLAIAQSYLRLSESRSQRGAFDVASQLIDKAAELAPDMPEIGAAREQIRVAQESARIEQTIAEGSAGELPAVDDQLVALQKTAPDRYPGLRDRWAKTLAKRVAGEKDYDKALALLDAAKRLFPGHPSLRNLVVEKPSVASKYATPGLDAVKKGRITEAERLLAQAEKKEPDHPETANLSKQLSARKAEAEDAFAGYEKALAAANTKSAVRYMKQAVSLWTDNDEWKRLLADLDRPVVASTSKDTCNPKFAGYGGRSSKARCFDSIQGKQGPSLVVIPAGGGSSRPFAITRFEISVDDFNLYCRSSGACSPVRARSGRMPVTGVSRQQAEAYAKWLSSTTGATYRLPKDNEWQYAAKAKGRQLPGSDFNCLLTAGGAAVKGGAPESVDRGSKNAWGLFNYVGNVQEWVISSRGLSARGGHYNDPADECGISLVRSHSGAPDKVTGFRLVREIRG